MIKKNKTKKPILTTLKQKILKEIQDGKEPLQGDSKLAIKILVEVKMDGLPHLSSPLSTEKHRQSTGIFLTIWTRKTWDDSK